MSVRSLSDIEVRYLFHGDRQPEQKELNAKLKQLEKEKNACVRRHNKLQRTFFINRVFDRENNLRFTNLTNMSKSKSLNSLHEQTMCDGNRSPLGFQRQKRISQAIFGDRNLRTRSARSSMTPSRSTPHLERAKTIDLPIIKIDYADDDGETSQHSQSTSCSWTDLKTDKVFDSELDDTQIEFILENCGLLPNDPSCENHLPEVSIEDVSIQDKKFTRARLRSNSFTSGLEASKTAPSLDKLSRPYSASNINCVTTKDSFGSQWSCNSSESLASLADSLPDWHDITHTDMLEGDFHQVTDTNRFLTPISNSTHRSPTSTPKPIQKSLNPISTCTPRSLTPTPAWCNRCKSSPSLIQEVMKLKATDNLQNYPGKLVSNCLRTGTKLSQYPVKSSSSPSSPRSSRKGSHENLCDKSIIRNITDTLPEQLMNKIRENSRKMAEISGAGTRYREMVEGNRQVASQDVLNDARWKRLERCLYNNHN